VNTNTFNIEQEPIPTSLVYGVTPGDNIRFAFECPQDEDPYTYKLNHFISNGYLVKNSQGSIEPSEKGSPKLITILSQLRNNQYKQIFYRKREDDDIQDALSREWNIELPTPTVVIRDKALIHDVSFINKIAQFVLPIINQFIPVTKAKREESETEVAVMKYKPVLKVKEAPLMEFPFYYTDADVYYELTLAVDFSQNLHGVNINMYELHKRSKMPTEDAPLATLHFVPKFSHLLYLDVIDDTYLEQITPEDPRYSYIQAALDIEDQSGSQEA
jgi:hypothetical protein